ncbi:MAG: beta-ketoacyl-[acyl-carrier-protein] synthase family protein, partial [Paracoccaceae bacterium]
KAGAGGASALDQRAGVIIGTAGGGHSTAEENYRAVFEAGKNRVPPLTVPRLMASAAPSQIGMEWGLQGPSFAVSSACASASHALGLAYRMIRDGQVLQMLAGGTDAMLTFGGIKAWEGLRILSPDGCRPFDQARNGLVMGEGAAIFLLEARDHALARGATVLAEIAGFAMNADARDLLSPSVEGIAAAMRAALADAGMAAAEIDYINAHATATLANDRAEAEAISDVFGPHVAVSSTKGHHGHAMGAAGAIELLSCLLALSEGVMPPSLGLSQPDPAFDLDLIRDEPRRGRVRACLSNSFAFGGLNAVLLLRQP